MNIRRRSASGSNSKRPSMPINNYYRSGGKPARPSSPFQKNPNKKGRAHKFLIRSIDGLVVLAVIFSLIYSLIVQPKPEVIINNSSYHRTQIYQLEAAKQFRNLTNRNKITLNEQKIIGSLQTKFPEIASATVELPIFSEIPKLHLDISAPSLVLKNSQSYIIDTNGVAVSQDPGLQPGLPTLIDQTGFATNLGKQVLSASEVSFIKALIAQSAKSKVVIQSLTLPPLAQELDVRTADQPYYVKFYLGGDALTQIGQFLAARHQFETTNVHPGTYLDVRVAGKIFYK